MKMRFEDLENDKERIKECVRKERMFGGKGNKNEKK
jgi:hypothetical protein